MNNSHLEKLFNKNIFSDLSITLKDANRSVHLNAHRILFLGNDYFKNLLTGSLKEKNTNKLTLQVSNVDICKDIIMSFYGTPIDPIKFSSYRYLLDYIKCCDYWLIPYENVLTDELTVPSEGFDLLLEIGELMNYSDQILKIIARNIPEEYDLSGIPNELKDRMIRLEQNNCIAVLCNDTIKIWNLNNGTVREILKLYSGHVQKICIISDKNQIITYGYSNDIDILDIYSGIRIRQLKGHTDLVLSMCYIQDKNQIISAGNDQTIKIWDLDSGTVIKTLNGYYKTVSSVCYIEWNKQRISYIEGKNQIISASTDSVIKIWDLDSGKVIKTLNMKTDKWGTKYIAQEKNQVACSHWDTIEIWDLDSGAVIKTLDADMVNTACYIKDKNQIASSTGDKIKIWDLDTGTVIKKLIGHTDSVHNICYIPEKNQIASASIDKTIKIWDLETGAIINSFDVDDTFKPYSLSYFKSESDIAKRLKN